MLRGSPRPVVRFRRGLIIGVTGAGRRRPGSRRSPGWRWSRRASGWPASGDGGGDRSRKARPKRSPTRRAAMATCPGWARRCRAISAGRSSSISAVSASRRPPVGAPPRSPIRRATAAEAERQRLPAAREAARDLGRASCSCRAAAAAASDAAGGGAPPRSGCAGACRFGTAAAGQHAEDRSGSVGAGRHESASAPAARRRPGRSSAGTVIPASLITGLNSDLPGTVVRAGDRECPRQRHRAHRAHPARRAADRQL